MLKMKLTISAAAFAAAYSFASPAQALFGLTCIPTLYNCMCTFRVPCPVSDPQDLAQFALEHTQMQERLALLQDLKEPGALLLRAMNGETPYGIPGIGSIGIDLNGILNGNLASLGIPALGGDLVSQLANLGIDGNLLSAIASGQLGVDDLLAVAQRAGLDLSVLEQVGLGIDQITALANGDLSVTGVLDLARTLGVEAAVLTELGITQDLIIGISQGNIDVAQLISVAEAAGLDMAALESVGLTAQTLANLPGAGPDYVASLLQNSGFDSSITTALGLDAGMIAQISGGQLPPSAIAQLVAGTGIDPSAIILPGVNGPIRVTDAFGSNVPSLGGSGMGGAGFTQEPPTPGPSTDDTAPSAPTMRSLNINDIITIPTASVPGLQNALDVASGASQYSGLFTGDDANLAAMCAADQSLISTSRPPNGFGDDVENIHMAIAGGSIEAAIEAHSAARSVGASTSTDGYARSIQIRPILIKAIEAVDTFDQMIQDSQSFQDDIIVNDTINTQLMTARAETASLMAYVMSTFGSEVVKSDYLSELPLFPETARFRDMVEQSSRTQAQRMNEQLSQQASSSAASMAEYHTIASKGQDALKNYNLLNTANGIRSAIPALEDTIQLHEDYKTGLFSLEQVIRSALLTLYGADDADMAWSLLHSQLLQTATQSPYTSADKWQTGYAASVAYSVALTPQAPATAYGTRVMVMPATHEDPPRYSVIGNTPVNYPAIDNIAASQSDPYNIIRTNYSGGGRDDSDELFGAELTGAIQYYIETARREIFTGEIRRGEVTHVMTGAFWNEMINHAPHCLSGPIALSPQALLERPEMFDLDKACDHLYWSYGDPGDYIDSSHLGGADAALWLSKINLDRIQNITGGGEAVLAELAAAIQAIMASTAGAELQMAGNAIPGRNLDLMLQALQTALQDPGFGLNIRVPQL